MSNYDLIVWLREQIAEKRRRAMRTAFIPDGPAATWSYERNLFRVVVHGDDHTVGVASRRAGTTPDGRPYEDVLLDVDGEHMEMNDPRAAVAECEAHTAILDQHCTPHTVVDGFCVEEGGECTHAGESECAVCGIPDCATVRALGLAFQHRPGYRQEWRP